MSSVKSSSSRRAFSLILSLFAFVALIFIGRAATRAAQPAAPTGVSANPDTADASADLGASDTPQKQTDASADQASSAAVEQLGDGGFVVDLNLASEADLRRLPGVGPARAKRILELRARLGRFKSVDDLARIKGFGKATLKRLRPLTRVGA